MDDKNQIADLEIAPLTDETLEEVAGGASDGSSGSCCSCCACTSVTPVEQTAARDAGCAS